MSFAKAYHGKSSYSGFLLILEQQREHEYYTLTKNQERTTLPSTTSDRQGQVRAPWTMDIDTFPRLGRRGAEFSGSHAGDRAGRRLRLRHGFEGGAVTIREVALNAFCKEASMRVGGVC